MNIWKRLRFYSVGVGIGLLMVLFFFGDRGCGGFLPERRVKDTIITRKFTSSELIDCKLQCNGYSLESIKNFIEEADVNFDSSKKTSDPQEYYLEYEGKTLIFGLPKDYELPVYIIDKFEEECPQCDTLSAEYNKDIKQPFKTKK